MNSNPFQNENSIKEKAFFRKIVSLFKDRETKKIDVLVVAHILPDAIPFFEALDSIFSIKVVFAKPKSINQKVQDFLCSKYNIQTANRDLLKDSEYLGQFINPKKDFVLIDIGGYFSKSSKAIKKKYGKKFLGSVEDTENGFSKYLKSGIDFPFIQVARSSLKQLEDFLVGQAISFSAEAIFREHGVLFNGLHTGIIGFGKIGKGIAHALNARQSIISVNDIDPVKVTHAYSKGFIPRDKQNLIKDSNIICLASGNKSIEHKDFKYIKNAAYLFTVTSADDELDIEWIERNYDKEEVTPLLTKYSRDEKFFYILNKGDAINFIHGTTVSTFILLVQTGIIASIIDLSQHKKTRNDYGLSDEIQSKISKIWLNIFTDEFNT